MKTMINRPLRLVSLLFYNIPDIFLFLFSFIVKPYICFIPMNSYCPSKTELQAPLYFEDFPNELLTMHCFCNTAYIICLIGLFIYFFMV